MKRVGGLWKEDIKNCIPTSSDRPKMTWSAYFFRNHHGICPIPGSKRCKLVPRASWSHHIVGWHHRNLVRSTPSCCLALRFQFSFPRHVKLNVFVQNIYGVSSVHKGLLPRYASRLWNQKKEMLIQFYCLNVSDWWGQRTRAFVQSYCLCMLHAGVARWLKCWYTLLQRISHWCE